LEIPATPGNTMRYHDLHLFVDDSGISLRDVLYRMIHPVRRESIRPSTNSSVRNGKYSMGSTVLA
jgi:hypothetical protein